MDSDPVPAKISRPKPLGVLARPRLFRLLDQARKRPVVWISAPPGAGKSTLVSHYLDQRRLKNLWYQVDEGDSDIATLFHYLALAAKKAAPRARKPLPQLAPEHVPNLSGFFRLFFQALFGRSKIPPVLVFDSYHEVAADAAFHEAVNEAIAQIPPGGNLFILSRGDPPAALALAQVNGLVARLDWDMLKLTAQEARRLVDLKTRSSLSKALQEQLYALCEGWVAGLLLLLEASTTQDISQFRRREFAPQVLFDYFGSQIFDHMDAGAREILVQSAFLPKMTIEAVEQLTGESHAGRIVQDLYRRNYFIVGHGEDPPVYQFHPLFRNFLLNRAPAMFASGRLHTIIRRAAALLAESGQFEDAMNLFREIKDEPGIVGIIVQHAPSLMKQGRTETILSWIHALSEQTVRRTPWVLYWQGACNLAAHHPAKSRPSLERALQLFDAEPNPAGAYLSWSALVNSILYSCDDCHPLDRWIDVFEELQARHGDFPSLEIEAQVAGSMFGALLFRQPDHPRMDFWERRLQALLSSVADPALAVPLGVHLLNYYVWFGHFSKARLLVAALDINVRRPTTPAVVLLHWGIMGAAYYWSTGDYEACARVFAGTHETARKQGLEVFASQILTQQAHVHLARGDFKAAAATLREVRENLIASRNFDLGHYHFLVSMTALFQEDRVLARESIQVALRAARESGAAFPQLAAHFGAAQVAFAEGDHEKSAAHVAQGRAFMSNVTVDYFCLLHEARLAFARGDETVGLRFLREALALGKQHGIVHYPWWSPAAMTDFYVKALDAGIEVTYVQSVIRKRGLVPGERLRCTHWPWPLKIYTLGGFRIEKNGEPMLFSGKVQRRPLDLLKITIALGGREVDTQRIIDGLWPEAEGDAAEDAFASALRRLRLLLGDPAALVLQDNKLSLDARRVWVDVWALEHLLNGKDAAPAEFAQILASYQGTFLEKEPDAAWAWPLRERLRNRFLRELARQGQMLMQDQHCEEAIRLFEKGLEGDGLAEDLYCNLMRCYQALGRRAEAVGVYERCRKLLSSTLGVAPSPATEALHRALKGQLTPCSG